MIRKRILRALSFTAFVCLALPQAVLAENGVDAEVRASTFGYSKDDATGCLRAALRSGAERVVVDNVGSEWRIGSINVPSDVELFFEDGVVVRAVDDYYKGKKNVRLFNVVKAENVKLVGHGDVTFIMNKKRYLEYLDDFPLSGQRHAINVNDSENVLIKGINIVTPGNDGVYVGSMKGSENVRVEDVNCEGAGRNGISVTGVRGLLVKNCKFNRTVGGGPQCGVDIEPNQSTGGIQDVVFENCEFIDNHAFGVIIGLKWLNGNHPPTSITFKDCVVKGKDAIRVLNTGQACERPGFIRLIDMEVEGHVGIIEHENKNLSILFKDVRVDNRAGGEEALSVTSYNENDINGLVIERLTVLDDSDREPIVFNSRFGNALTSPRIADVVKIDSKGRKTVFDVEKFLAEAAPDPLLRNFKPAVLDLNRLEPIAEKGAMAGIQINFRESCEYYLHAKAGEEVTVNFNYVPVHKFVDTRQDIPVRLFSPTGKLIKELKLAYDTNEDFSFKAEEEGIHHFSVKSGGQCVNVRNEISPGQAFGYGDQRHLSIFNCSGELFFTVPAGVELVSVEAGATGRGGESDVFLVNPAGDVVDQKLTLSSSEVLKAKRERPEKTEIWSVRFKAIKLFLRLPEPIPPLFSTSRKNVLTVKNDLGVAK